MACDYTVKKPMVFLIIKVGQRFKWQMWKDRKIIAESAETYGIEKDARKAVERLVDSIRRNPVSPRILSSCNEPPTDNHA